jgi:hypothetical protein
VLSVILSVIVPVLAAVAGMILVQRLVPPALRQEHNDVAGFIYAVLGVAYAVLLAFVVIVVWEEWPLMERRETSERAGMLLQELRLSLENVDASTSAGQVLYDQGLTRIHEVSDARRLRLVEVTEGLPGILWVVLIGGGVVTVCFTYLFGLKNNWAHALMVAALTLVICGILFTIGTLDHPFAGQAEIQPTAFEEVLRSFEKDPGH